ncbi:MAG: type II secretion system F family protein [Burkholderiaceae bacterium]
MTSRFADSLINADWFSVTLPVLSLGVALSLCFYLLAPRIERRYWSPKGRLRQANRDPLPAAQRVFQIPCTLIGVVIGPFLPASYQSHVSSALSRAGLERAVSTAEFAAAQGLLGGLGFLMTLAGYRAGGLPGLMVWIVPLVGLWWPWAKLADITRRRRARVSRDLPVFLDLINLGVRGGLTTGAAISLAVERGPRGPLGSELAAVLREIRAGRQRHDAMRSLAERMKVGGLTHAVGAIVTAERQGADVAQVLQAQAAQRRHERFLHAEQQAMKAPVKMLLPLVVFIFPGTFLILMFPVALQLMDSGLL